MALIDKLRDHRYRKKLQRAKEELDRDSVSDAVRCVCEFGTRPTSDGRSIDLLLEICRDSLEWANCVQKVKIADTLEAVAEHAPEYDKDCIELIVELLRDPQIYLRDGLRVWCKLMVERPELRDLEQLELPHRLEGQVTEAEYVRIVRDFGDFQRTRCRNSNVVLPLLTKATEAKIHDVRKQAWKTLIESNLDGSHVWDQIEKEAGEFGEAATILWSLCQDNAKKLSFYQSDTFVERTLAFFLSDDPWKRRFARQLLHERRRADEKFWLKRQDLKDAISVALRAFEEPEELEANLPLVVHFHAGTTAAMNILHELTSHPVPQISRLAGDVIDRLRKDAAGSRQLQLDRSRIAYQAIESVECFNCGKGIQPSDAFLESRNCPACGWHNKKLISDSTSKTPYRLWKKATLVENISQKVALLKSAVELCPSHQRSLYLLGKVLQEEVRDYQQAAEFLHRAASAAIEELAGEPIQQFKMNMLDRAATCYQKFGELHIAVQLWEQVLYVGDWSPRARAKLEHDIEATRAMLAGETPILRTYPRGNPMQRIDEVLNMPESQELAEQVMRVSDPVTLVELVQTWGFSESDAKNLVHDALKAKSLMVNSALKLYEAFQRASM